MVTEWDGCTMTTPETQNALQLADYTMVRAGPKKADITLQNKHAMRMCVVG